MSDIVIRAVTSASPVIKATVSASPVIKPSNAVGPQGIPGPIGENGDVVGPETSVGDNFASWDGTGGNTLKDSGSKASDFATASHNHSGTYLESVVDDTTPQLGGNLDVNGKTFTQSASAPYEYGTDYKQVDFNQNTAFFTEVDNTTSTSIDWRKSNKQKSSPSSAPTYTYTAPGGACHLTHKIVMPATPVTPTFPAALKWVGSEPSWDTGSKTYLVVMYYDGTNYWASCSVEVSA